MCYQKKPTVFDRDQYAIILGVGGQLHDWLKRRVENRFAVCNKEHYLAYQY